MGIFNRAQGLSLMEIAVVMIVVSLSLAPIIQSIGGPQSTSGQGNITRITALKSRETVLANSQIEKVLSGDFQSMECDNLGNPIGHFEPDSDLPTPGSKTSYHICSTGGSHPLYYQWTVVNPDDTAQNGPQLPAMNSYYLANFNVLSQPGGNILLSIPFTFFYNRGAYAKEELKTGVVLAIDTSLSMRSSKPATYLPTVEGVPVVDNSGTDAYEEHYVFVFPWMYYRYDPNLFTGSTWGPNFTGKPIPYAIPLNMWDDSQLDLSYGKIISSGGSDPDLSDPNPDTAFNEKFPYGRGSQVSPVWMHSILGTGNCSLSDPNMWAFNTAGSDPNLAWSFLPRVKNDEDLRNPVNEFCSPKADTASWSAWMGDNMPRIEAIRTAALSLLLMLEQNPSVTKTIQLGFLPWNTTPDLGHAIPLESAQTINGVQGLHFKNTRGQLLWINRADPSNKKSHRSIPLLNSTRIDLALRQAQAELLNSDCKRRIMVLLTDGAPYGPGGTNTPAGSNDPTSLINYANSIGNGASLDERTTIFTVGLIEADENLLQGIANNTPGGEAFIAHDVADLTPIFQSIAYQIQKYALLNTSDRYNIDLE